MAFRWVNSAIPRGSRTPLPELTEALWTDAAAATETARVHRDLTEAFLTPGAAQDILAPVLGMRVLLLGMPELARQFVQAEPSTRAHLVHAALKDRERVEAALQDSGVTVMPMDSLSAPADVGRVVAVTVGSELEQARFYVLDHAAYGGLLRCATRLTPTDVTTDAWRGTGTSHGFMVFPESLYVHDDGEAIGSMRALSWAPRPAETAHPALHLTAWSQTYGGISSPDWSAVLEEAERKQVTLPRLTYGAAGWVAPPSDEVPITYAVRPVAEDKQGVFISSGNGALLPRLVLAAIQMIRTGAFRETRVLTRRGTRVHLLTLRGRGELGA